MRWWSSKSRVRLAAAWEGARQNAASLVLQPSAFSIEVMLRPRKPRWTLPCTWYQ